MSSICELAPSLFQVLEQETSVIESYEPCQGDEIKSCVSIDVDFNTIDQSDRLKVFCTSVERKIDASESNQDDTRFYEVHLVQCISDTGRMLRKR